VTAGDAALGTLVAVLWGFAFVATRIGLDSFSPAQLAALRFLVAGLPVLVLPRPRIGWPLLIATGLTLFAGQFLFQFFGIAHGMPPGLAALVVHTQAFFTVIFAAVFLRERPGRRQVAGMALAFAGLLLIAATTGHDLVALGFVLTLVSAVSWGIGNIFVKHIRGVPQLELMVWLSLVVPLPALVISALVDGPAAFGRAVVNATWGGWIAALYLGLVGTVLAYTIWGRLLRRYPVASVAPFSLLVPFVGALSSAIVFGERFGALRLVGMASVLAGLAVIVLPLERWVRSARVLSISIAVVVTASVVPVHAMTGTEWRRQPEPARRAYVDGVIDAWQGVVTVQESVGTRDRGIGVFADVVHCLRDRLLLPAQVYTVVDRHVEDNPGLLSKDMADIVFAALSQTCRR
jgi:O-acetylserine/cysteine efflux transporter